MKKIILLLFSFLISVSLSAQETNTSEYPLTSSNLGFWCYLDVNYVNGRYVGVMPVPPEGIPWDSRPNGPGMPWYENQWSSSYVNVVFQRFLPIDLSTYAEGVDIIIEIPVNKWISSLGGTTTNPEYGIRQCYYYCILRPQFDYDHF